MLQRPPGFSQAVAAHDGGQGNQPGCAGQAVQVREQKTILSYTFSGIGKTHRQVHASGIGWDLFSSSLFF